MAQTVVLMFLMTLTLTCVLLIVTQIGHEVGYCNLFAKFHMNPSRIMGDMAAVKVLKKTYAL